MRLRPNRASQRALALTLAALSLAAAYFLTLHWWFSQPLLHVADEIAVLRHNQQRYMALSIQRPALENSLAQLRNSSVGNDNLLADSDMGAATAQLMQLIAADLQAFATVGGGCTLTNRIPVNIHQQGPYRQVSVRINLECAIEPLAGLLYGLENGKVSLFIESFKVEKNRGRPSISNRLTAQLLISAYLQNPAPKGVTP
ncbi:general secretion pathway protein GspM [Pseudomonas lactis]|uniref:General secretion pathway protein GspM n=1 Tax=Pseudomonas lactis TaxID=1615674 RepID=A0A7Y1LB37_9PSED|nr:type II secretion system protein GspM [Pseudomonas lactis]NNA42859.1 general secretion pathway protein GspM [Pseudomonas lactis]